MIASAPRVAYHYLRTGQTAIGWIKEMMGLYAIIGSIFNTLFVWVLKA